MMHSTAFPQAGAETRYTALAGVIAVAAPVLVAAQPLLPDAIQPLVIFGRLVVAPLVILILLRRAFHWPTLLLILELILLTGYVSIEERGNHFALVALSLLGSIVGFRFGTELVKQRYAQSVWHYLILGVTIVNLVTITIYASALLELIDIQPLLEVTQRDEAFGISRFSLGNAIEMPYVLTALLYAGVRSADPDRSYLPVTIVNLVTALLSESRIVVVVAALIVARQLIRSRLPTQLATVVLLLSLATWGWIFVEPTISSLLLRYGGEDFGSRKDREFLLSLVLGNIGPLSLIVGGGLTSSAQLMYETTGVYRSVESVALQLLFEVGVLGVALIAATLLAGRDLHQRVGLRPSVIAWLLWIQLLLFLPIFTLMPFAAFALGAVSLSGRANGPYLGSVRAQVSSPSGFVLSGTRSPRRKGP